jgi:DNA-directed RNA polymerase subunit M/transcription elongation factor TFIIS
MAITAIPTCPSCGAWNVEVAYRAARTEAVPANDDVSGRCNACNHRWSEEL